MGEKIKKVFAVIGAVFTVVFCTVFLLLRRRDSYRLRSDGTSERDRVIQEGIAECQGGIESVEGRIETVEESVGRCEEHLRRAEDILRNAIKRSRKGEANADETSNSNNSV